MIGERLGIATAAQERTRRFAERHPALARFFLGRGPDYAAQPKLIKADPAYKGMPSIAGIMAAHGQKMDAKAMGLPAVKVDAPKVEIGTDGRRRRRVRLRLSYASAIAQVVCQVWGVRYEDLVSPSRRRCFARPRFAAYRLMRERCGVSFPEIAKYFRRDHTTVIDGMKQAARLMVENDEWRANYDAANALLDEAAKGSPA